MRLISLYRSSLLGALGVLGVMSPAPARAAVTLQGDAATAFDSKVFVSGLSTPTDLTVLPDGRVIIVQKAGDIATVPAAGGTPIEDHIDVNTTSEQGLLGVVADPNFATNQYIYLYADRPGSDSKNRHQVFRYKFGADSKLGTKTVVIDMGLEGPANHDGGGMDIYQGNIYIGVGDTGANASPPKNHYGSCLNHGNGKVLRLSIADATLGQPPADNPLMGVDMVTGCDTTAGPFNMAAPNKAIFAWGFRNPFRVWVDKTTGNVWVGDVGEVTREEVDVVQKGKHHGYPFWEGGKDWTAQESGDLKTSSCMTTTPASDCVAPVYDYDRSGMDASIIGGRILDGCGWPAAFKSRYIFGDYNMGKIWTLDVNAKRDGVDATSRKDFATVKGLTDLRMGSDNALYVLEEGGTVTRITAKGTMSTAGSCLSVNGDAASQGTGGAGNTGGSSSGGSATGGSATGGSASGGGATTGGKPSSGGSMAAGGSDTPAGGSDTTMPGSGGSPSNSGGGDPSDTAGTAAATAGTDGVVTGGKPPADSGGCGCRMAGDGAGASKALGALLIGGLGLGLRRRRGRPS